MADHFTARRRTVLPRVGDTVGQPRQLTFRSGAKAKQSQSRNELLILTNRHCIFDAKLMSKVFDKIALPTFELRAEQAGR
jgi:hypothetical protein